MATELVRKPLEQMTTQEIRAITASMPANGRAAWGKVLAVAAKHVKAMKGDYSRAFELAHNVVRNAWHLGRELEPVLPHQGGRPAKNNCLGNCFPTLAELGVEPTLSMRCQRLASRYETLDDLDAYIETFRNEVKYTLPSLRPASEAAHVSEATGMPEWYTPPEFLDSVREVMGAIDLDPASSPVAQERVKAKKFFTQKQDGLRHKWSGRVFLNPPYSPELVGKFVRKLVSEYSDGKVEQYILLINNATETAWFQAVAQVSAAICFPKTRIRFLDEGGNPGAPLQGQAFLYGGENASQFTESFQQFGFCCIVCKT